MKKKTVNILKVVRVILAILLFMPVLLFFIDFADLLPDSFNSILRRQLMPALLSGAYATLIIYLLATIAFGRIYCSIICPAGILQDIFNRLACIGRKKKNGVMRFRYHKPANWLRYSILGITAVLALFGLTELCLLLDPYSNFGRIAANIFRPALIYINNIAAGLLTQMDNYSLYKVSLHISTGALIAACVAFLVFAVMVFLRGRLFCNTLCPVGALLSLVSRYSLFRLAVDESACNKCGVCERKCKAEAIDSKTSKIDASLCVSCYNCMSSCSKNAISYKIKSKASAVKAESAPSPQPSVSSSRRSFIATSAALAGSVPIVALAKNASAGDDEKALPVTPPGSLGIERFKDLCTGCHICVVQCPSRVLLPAGLQYGFGYMLKPYMSYRDSFCNFGCTVCSHVCPTNAITPITEEDKKTTQVGIAKFYIDRCIVKTEENDCGACSEHCPTQAVHMVPYKGTLTIPHVEPELCVGCGGCESICPVRPRRAIIIASNPVHLTAEKPAEEEIKKVEVDDFGF
jgi:ferredoxin